MTRKSNPTLTNRTAAAVWVLIIEDQPAARDVCEQVIANLGYNPLVVESGEQALEVMERQLIDIVVADILMPGMKEGKLVQEMKARNPRVELAIITAKASEPAAVQAIKLGASEYIVKPFSVEEMRIVIERLSRTLDLKDENQFLRAAAAIAQPSGADGGAVTADAAGL